MPDIRLTLGPMLIGVFLNMILYGVLLVQMYSYYRTYKADKPWIKYLVLYLFIIETLNTALDIHIMYEPLILQHGTAAMTTYFPTLLPSEPLVIAAVSTPIQFFFAFRIRMFTKSNWIPALVMFLSVLSLSGGVWTAVKWVQIKLIVRKPELHYPALLWFLSSSVADVVITIALVRGLSKRRTGFVATDDVISKIIRMTIQTGLPTALVAVGDVVFFMTLGHSTLNLIWDLTLTKLYSNCLLSTLNARASWNDLTRSVGPISDPMLVEQQGYELENAIKSFDVNSVVPRPDTDYGITVTKVFERMQDPRPSMRATQF